MEPRLRHATAAPGALQAMLGLERYLEGCGLDSGLVHLVKLRVSQMNGCAYCIDMHWKDLRAAGETEERLYMLDAWEESALYTPRERAALAWAEAVTNVQDGHVGDAVYAHARAAFDETQLANLTLAVTTINAWNRLNVAFRTPAGEYTPRPRHDSKG